MKRIALLLIPAIDWLLPTPVARAAEAGITFDCQSPGFFLSLGDFSSTFLYRTDFVDLPNLLTQPIGSRVGSYNAIAYNTSDDFIYAIDAPSRNVLQLRADGSIVDLGPVGLSSVVVSGAYSPATG